MEYPRKARAASHPLVVLLITLSSALLSGSASGEGPGDDGVAPGTVAFFGSETAACPDGWAPAEYAMGRLVVSVVEEPLVGRQVGEPLADQEDRTHEHAYFAAINLAYKSVSAADGGNNEGAKAQLYPVEGTTEPAASGLPFIQLLVCEKK